MAFSLSSPAQLSVQPSSPADTLNSSGIMRLMVGGAESWMFGSVNVVNTDRIYLPRSVCVGVDVFATVRDAEGWSGYTLCLM